MDLTAPESAPTSNFIIEDDAAESCRTGRARAANTPVQERYEEPASAPAAMMAPERKTTAADMGNEHAMRAVAVSPALDALSVSTQDLQQLEQDPSAAASLLSLTSGQSLAQAYAVQPCEAAAKPQTAAPVAGESAVAAAAGTAAPSLCEVLGQLENNTAGIRAAEEALQHLLAKQAMLLQLGLKLEQQHVISVLKHPLGFHLGRPVAAVLLLRCFHQWGVFSAAEAPVLEQVACVLQDSHHVRCAAVCLRCAVHAEQQLSLDDESAPSEVAGLQCRVAYWLTVSSVLLCLLLKTANPQAAAAAAAHNSAAGRNRRMASHVITAARKRVGEIQQRLAGRVGHGVGGLQGGLQALGRRFGGWGKGATGKSDDGSAAAAAAGSGSAAECTLSGTDTAAAAADEEAATDVTSAAAVDAAGASTAAAAADVPVAADVAGRSCSSTSSTSAALTGLLHRSTNASSSAAAAAAATPKLSPAVEEFMLCLDALVQKSFILLRDQLKRRLAPLLSDCMMNPGLVSQETMSSVTSLEGTDSLTSGEGLRSRSSLVSMGSYNHAGAAVGGAAAANRREAEAVLMNFRSWSELVGVLHAAVVALRGAGVPRALTAVLVQQVLEFINCQMFNQLLLRPECCSASNARYALRGLKQLDGWILAEHSACGHELPWSPPSRSPTPTAITPNATGEGTPAAAAGGSDGGSKPDAATAAAATAAAAGNDRKKSPWADATVAAAAAADDNSWEQIAADCDFDNWQPPKQQRGVRLWQRHEQQQQQQQEGQGQQQLLQHDIGPEAWHALSHVRQALQFLVLEHKGALSLDELSTQICPALNYQQLYRLCTTAWTDTPGEDGCVSGEVLEEMKRHEKLSTNGGLIVTFLLDDPTTPPFVAAAAAAGDAYQQVESSAASKSGVESAASTVSTRSSGSSSGSMRCKASSVVLWDDGRDYGCGMPVPAALVNDGCPAAVFSFLEVDRPWVQY